MNGDVLLAQLTAAQAVDCSTALALDLFGAAAAFELVNKLQHVFQQAAQRFAAAPGAALGLVQAWLPITTVLDCMGAGDLGEVSLFAELSLLIMSDSGFQEFRRHSCNAPLQYKNGMPGRVWRTGAVQVVQNLRIVPPSLHPRSHLREEDLDRVAEVLYIPVHDQLRPTRGPVAVLEAFMASHSTQAVIAADFLSFVSHALGQLQLSVANPLPQPIRRSALCGRRARADPDDSSQELGQVPAGTPPPTSSPRPSGHPTQQQDAGPPTHRNSGDGGAIAASEAVQPTAVADAGAAPASWAGGATAQHCPSGTSQATHAAPAALSGAGTQAGAQSQLREASHPSANPAPAAQAHAGDDACRPASPRAPPLPCHLPSCPAAQLASGQVPLPGAPCCQGWPGAAGGAWGALPMAHLPGGGPMQPGGHPMWDPSALAAILQAADPRQPGREHALLSLQLALLSNMWGGLAPQLGSGAEAVPMQLGSRPCTPAPVLSPPTPALHAARPPGPQGDMPATSPPAAMAMASCQAQGQGGLGDQADEAGEDEEEDDDDNEVPAKRARRSMVRSKSMRVVTDAEGSHDSPPSDVCSTDAATLLPLQPTLLLEQPACGLGQGTAAAVTAPMLGGVCAGKFAGVSHGEGDEPGPTEEQAAAAAVDGHGVVPSSGELHTCSAGFEPEEAPRQVMGHAGHGPEGHSHSGCSSRLYE